MGISIENWLFGSISMSQLALKFNSYCFLFSVIDCYSSSLATRELFFWQSTISLGKSFQDIKLDPLDKQPSTRFSLQHYMNINLTELFYFLKKVRPTTCSIGVHENIKQLFLSLFLGLVLPILNRTVLDQANKGEEPCLKWSKSNKHIEGLLLEKLGVVLVLWRVKMVRLHGQISTSRVVSYLLKGRKFAHILMSMLPNHIQIEFYLKWLN